MFSVFILRNMGVWDEMCLVCGGPPEVPNAKLVEEMMQDEGARADLAAIKAMLQKTAWLNKYIGITPSEKPLKLGAYTGYGSFSVRKGVFHGATNAKDESSGPCGLTCHADCYKHLELALGYRLRFAHIWPLLMKQRQAGNYFTKCSYGGISKYWGQSFATGKLLKDGKAWMLQSPLHDAKNAQRVLAVWKPIVAKLAGAGAFV